MPSKFMLLCTVCSVFLHLADSFFFFLASPFTVFQMLSETLTLMALCWIIQLYGEQGNFPQGTGVLW